MLLKATAHRGTDANAKKRKTGDERAHADERNVLSSHWSQTPNLKTPKIIFKISEEKEK